MKISIGRTIPFLLTLALLLTLWMGELRERAGCHLLNADTVTSAPFRRQALSETAIERLRGLEAEERGEAAAFYLLNRALDGAAHTERQEERLFGSRQKEWTARPGWADYLKACQAIWNDVRYFPVPQSTLHREYTVNYVDSWMGERTFGGKRGHEGTDIMASVDQPGLYPVVSMTDGVVSGKGWLTKGGYRLGIEAPSGAYFYYAHLHSYAALEEGDQVRAGDVIGFMGNTGYGPEGTTGMFATHLHVGIYLYPDGRETSVDPYWVLRMIEEKKLSCSF